METPQSQQLLRDFYESLYFLKKHDSPEKSRVSMTKRILDILKTGVPSWSILDIGSGPQSLEKQLLSTGNTEIENLLERSHFFTLDFSKILKTRLLALKGGNVKHIQADALKLPFNDEIFGLVVSNYAIDIMPKEALLEAYRVLAKKGRAIFYFHHPDMIPEDLSIVKDKDVRLFWQYLKANQILFKNEGEISSCLGKIGFTVEEVSLNFDEFDKWWEVVASKN